MRFVTKNIEELSSDTLICFIFEVEPVYTLVE